MSHECIDTNVIVRFLVETPKTIEAQFKGVFNFFEKLESGACIAMLPDIVLFQTYFVLTSHYGVPGPEAAGQLAKILKFKGIILAEKNVALECLALLQHAKTDIVDAWIIAYSKFKKVSAVYSFDKGFISHGIRLLKVE
jgi:Predicted nucleic-acid-binding protein, contains PIN domain